MGTGMITIRPLQTGDVAAAAGLAAAWQDDPWSETLIREELGAQGRAYVLAEKGGVLIGFGGVMVVGDDAHLTNLLVGPDHRRRGVGSRLLARLIESALAMGGRHLTLEVRSRNAEARRLYRRFGLAPVGARPRYYRDDDALIMWAHDIDHPDYRRRLEGLSGEGRRQGGGGG